MNLENQAQLQTVLTKDGEDSARIIKKLQSTVTAYEKQHARDQMIIKFRDSTIKKLNQKGKMSDEQSAEELDKYIKETDCLKESIDQNPKLAKLFSDNESLT